MADHPIINAVKLRAATRRHFLSWGMGSLGAFFLNDAFAKSLEGGNTPLDFRRDPATPLSVLPPQFKPRAKRVIYLHMGGGPSTLDLFEYKPALAKYNGKDTPDSYLKGRRFSFITGIPKLLGPQFPFHRAGKSGQWFSDRLPHLEKHADDICFIKTMKSDQFNHAPSQLYLQTGDAKLGHASLGSWVTYGLGTENQNLPGFIVLSSQGTNGETASAGKPLWGSGYLPSAYQGVQFRTGSEPVLYLDNPRDVSRDQRRQMLDAIDEVNRKTYDKFGNPETVARIAQYEMAFRMQMTASDAIDIRKEPKAVLERYGAEPGQTSFANNCVVARRLAERGVRFIQLYHWGWDSHGAPNDGGVNIGMANRCKETDQPIAALLSDLKASGLLEDTLVVWGGEFGRTPMLENRAGQQMAYVGRDHHPHAFAIWMAGGGMKPGISHGETDEMGFDVANGPVEVRDLHATILYALGFDAHRLNYPYQGLDQKLIGQQPARVVSEILA
jgi:hypothetical protein